jgi:hypothetical protein
MSWWFLNGKIGALTDRNDVSIAEYDVQSNSPSKNIENKTILLDGESGSCGVPKINYSLKKTLIYTKMITLTE